MEQSSAAGQLARAAVVSAERSGTQLDTLAQSLGHQNLVGRGSVHDALVEIRGAQPQIRHANLMLWAVCRAMAQFLGFARRLQDPRTAAIRAAAVVSS